MKKLNLLTILLTAVLLASCSGDDDTVDRSTITLESITRLEELPASSQYEVWLVSGGENISLGRFNNLSNGQTFSALTGQVADASGIKISIEPGNDPSPEISETVLLSGSFNGNSADLSIRGSLGDFSNASGNFTLWTPTDDNTSNNQNGVYFVAPNDGNPQAGLNLPVLPDGWRYEGWVTVPNASNQMVNLSTGRFSSPSGRDESAAYSSQINTAPPFPGEDFINMTILSQIGFNAAPNLTLKKIFISVEPEPDFDYANPFVIQPLINPQSGTSLYPNIQNMDLNTLSFPRGVISR
ncbi:anti-sigma factor [Leeuwenhoekiella marinoflava]|uniref:Anti-sigma-K factor rskA n=2 Tax=Leeuwenhoekiella marinoflava TaxID=988 RepID=A0A4V1KS33_9FLAO|nr:anti-sigma factor [Leeuwenhoekiella marinoflava]RXG27222.1 anti-sigma-K factor rskA [Leeuwenhoekiella marinoflava]SHF79140.1 Anti-sigma-K factor rskA [Leeuwenhoekiella marinoflava DSM 3653]